MLCLTNIFVFYSNKLIIIIIATQAWAVSDAMQAWALSEARAFLGVRTLQLDKRWTVSLCYITLPGKARLADNTCHGKLITGG